MTGDSETETSWKIFLESLKTRGLEGVDLVVSNAHKGLKSSIQKEFREVSWHSLRSPYGSTATPAVHF